MKAKGRAGEGEPSDHDPSQNPMKQRGRKEYWERKVSDSCTAGRKFWPADGEHLRQNPPFKKSQVLGFPHGAQWLRIHLPMQGTWVQALVWEDPTCCGATRPMCHNY